MERRQFIGQTVAAAVALPAAMAAARDEAIEGFKDTPLIPGTSWHVHDPDRPQPRVVVPGATFSHLAPAPSDAVVLFDGTDLSRWETAKGGKPGWKVAEGYAEIVGGSGSIRTRDRFADFQLHIEFCAPAMSDPAKKGQGRGNSGILMNGLYEIQVLDSFQSKTYPDGQAGALYGQSPPAANAAKPPGQWQTYDIVFESPRWNERGELVKKASATVIHNGVVLHNRREYTGPTPYRAVGRYGAPHAPEVFIELQDHGDAVKYRNIWLRSMSEAGGST